MIDDVSTSKNTQDEDTQTFSPSKDTQHEVTRSVTPSLWMVYVAVISSVSTEKTLTVHCKVSLHPVEYSSS